MGMIASVVLGCRPTYPPIVTKSGQEGGSGTNHTVQCSGWFPDWIALAEPPAGAPTFRLAQGYPLGVPIVSSGPNGAEITEWAPPRPDVDAPWLRYDFTDPRERSAYLNAIKTYALEDMVPYDFVPQNGTLGKKHWYHVPMMTSGFFPREPRHGLTEERSLRTSEHPWLSRELGAYAIGFYNELGGYTIGQVFDDPEPSNSDPSKAQFIDGTLVFKILFVEYDPGAILGPNPLANAPQWEIQRPRATFSATFPVRLLQMDIAVKDPRSTATGWVFATYVYDESLPAATPGDRWYNLTPVGLQWGNDPDVDAPGDPDLDETWINPEVPAPFDHHVGLHGRLNGPVDNPASACMSCHSTAQVWEGASTVGAYTAARMVPDDCTAAQSLHWFRNLPGSVPFGQMTVAPSYCVPATPPVGTPPLWPLDYSLQVQRGLVNGVALNHPNPCLSLIPTEHLPTSVDEADVTERSIFPAAARRAGAEAELPSWEALGMEPDPELLKHYPRR